MDSKPMKLPSNYFMEWLREKISIGQIRLNFHFDDKERYLDRFLCSEIDNWNPSTPVVISAQTGAGKNYFIQNTLLPKLIEENPGQNNLILILSNRIALNRQTKYKFAELLVEYKHDAKYLTEIRDFYTPEGIDHIYINFDVVTVCSYHQLYKRSIRSTKSVNDPNFVASIDISKFKYIVCDECHFFTSDASFNKETDKILKEIVTQGQNAVRIYLSATPEVAFEAILREEFAAVKEQLDREIEFITAEMDEIGAIFRCYEIMGMNKRTASKAMKREVAEKSDRFYELEREKNRLTDEYCFPVAFYYMARNYDYVEPHFYQQNEELVELIQSSVGKWIIFTDSNGAGIDKSLREKGIESIFLSRKGIESGGERKKAYNYIIDSEMIDKKVLVTTSILDNGINITNASLKNPERKVLNIAIDSFDRVQFIQMLGRIRFEKNVSIQLYVKKYSIERLKNLLTRDARSLIQILQRKMREPLSSEFNVCAVYHLIDRMSTMLAMIRNEEPNFCITFKDYKEEALKGTIYEFYKTGARKNEVWSRSIVDLLESSVENVKRRRYLEEDIDNGESDVTRHENKLTDTFVRYLYRELIPLYYESIIQAKYDFYVNQLSEREYNRYKHLIALSEKDKGTLSIIEKTELLNDNFDFTIKDVFVNVEFVRQLNERSDYYKGLAERLYGGNSADEQLIWLEKCAHDERTDNVANAPLSETSSQTENDCDIVAYSCTASEIKVHKRGKYLDKNFLVEKGIKKAGDLAKAVSGRYFQGKELAKALGEKLEVEGSSYELRSFGDNTNQHTTYYIFVKLDE